MHLFLSKEQHTGDGCLGNKMLLESNLYTNLPFNQFNLVDCYLSTREHGDTEGLEILTDSLSLE